MQGSRSRRIGISLIAGVWVFLATSAIAGPVTGPPVPDIFSDDFGIRLAENRANGASVLDHIGDLASDPFPWNGDFAFPVELPPLPRSNRPVNFPDGGGAGGLSGSRGVGHGSQVPEPDAAQLLALGLVSLVMARRRRSA